LFDGKLYQKTLCFALHFSLLIFSECFTVILISSLGWVYDLTRLSSLVFLDILTAATFILISYLTQNIRLIVKDNLDRRLKMLLIPSSCALLSCMIIMYFNAVPNIMEEIFSLSPAFLSCINLFSLHLPLLSLTILLYFAHQLSVSITETETARFQAKTRELELRHYQDLVQRDNNLRRLHHDMKNHLLVINALGQSGDIERQRLYIEKLNDAYVHTEKQLTCGHLLIDILIQSKARRMNDSGIDVHWNLSPIPTALPVSDIDLCSLFSNLFDNAIEACDRLDSNRKITTTLYTNGQHLCLQITNSAQHSEELIRSMRTISQKRKNQPGIGLHACQQILDRYQGIMTINPGRWESSVEVNIVLPCLV